MAALSRRAFVELVGFGLLARIPSAGAQTSPQAVRIGWLSGGAATLSGSLVAFDEALRGQGFVAGRNVILDVRQPERGTASEYARLAARLVAAAPAVIVAANPSSLDAVTRATTSIPIVGVDLESDPVARGWVTSLARPGRNLTGFFLDIPEITGKYLQMLREVRPTLVRVAVLGDPRINELQFRATESVVSGAGLALHPMAITEANGIARAVADAAQQKAGALMVLTSPAVNLNLGRIAAAALKHRLPTICGFVPQFAEAGGLLAYGPDFPDLFRRAAGQVAAIVKGASAAELPVQRPTKFPLVINAKTARILGVTLPPTLLARADRLIE